jgi:3-polyprenyl-4-hydroxybenzoate decarboxylase
MSPLQTIIVVDEDINIYNAEDVMWALTTRIFEKEDIIDLSLGKVAPRPGIARKTGYDATIPFAHKSVLIRALYPKVNLEKWFTKEEIEKVRAQQSEYARFLADERR